MGYKFSYGLSIVTYIIVSTCGRVRSNECQYVVRNPKSKQLSTERLPVVE